MRAGLFLLAILACSAAVQAQASTDDAFSHIPEVVRQLIEDIVTASNAEVPVNKRLLLTSGGMDSVQTFFSNMLGHNWTHFLPSNWALPSFNWDVLGTFEYSSNLQDFVDNVNLTKPDSLLELHQRMEQIESIFCTNETFVPSAKVDASCTGPTVTLAYVPKVCVLDPVQKTVVCDPAKLVLSKAPGACTHSYHSASKWSGKECKISGSVGFVKAALHGGAPYRIPLKSISVDYQP